MKTFRDLNNIQLEEIARLIKEGFSSGRLDEENGEKVAWKLEINIWND